MSIFAPNLYLCAYHLRKYDTQGETHLLWENPLWENCDRLLSHFTETRLIPQLHEGEHRILLPPNQTEIPFTLPDCPDMEGFIQPVQLQEDSYGVFLNIGYDEETPNLEDVEIPVLQQFNPDHHLQFPLTPSFLGETLILTLWLTRKTQQHKSEYLTQLANQCYQALFPTTSPPLSRSGELFGSSIFEYGNPREPDKSPHVLIWLFRDELADQTLQKCFSSTFDLFFYRHKVSKAFQDSRNIYKQLRQYYCSLDPILDDIQLQIDTANPDPQDTTYLQNLKTQLKQLSADSLNYDRLLRKMKDLLTTININLNNYNETIERICATLELDKEELSFWRYFGETTAPYFREQIEANLSYFDQGTGLIRQAVASIRAIVEIDQAQCDRQSQKEEATYYKQQQENNQQLQDQIQAVGVGIAAGAIVASVSGLATEPWHFPNGEKIELPFIPPHPFLIGFFSSIICSLGAWWITKRLIQQRRSHPKPPNK